MKITDKYLFFWRYNEIPSNWYPTNFILRNIKFTCSEQCFIYYKAKLFKDDEIAKQILETTNPRIQRELGRKVKNFNNQEWEKHREKAMFYANKEKFLQNDNLKKWLLDTNNLILVEASSVDKIWGVGLDEKNSLILDEKNWTGLNLLGKILMDVRNYIRFEK